MDKEVGFTSHLSGCGLLQGAGAGRVQQGGRGLPPDRLPLRGAHAAGGPRRPGRAPVQTQRAAGSPAEERPAAEEAIQHGVSQPMEIIT